MYLDMQLVTSEARARASMISEFAAMYCSIPDGFVRKDKKMELIHGGNRWPKPVDFEWGCQGLAGLLQRFCDIDGSNQTAAKDLPYPASSGEPEIAESTGTSCRRRFVPTVAVGILRRCHRTARVAPISRHHGGGWRPSQSVGTTSRRR